MKKTTMNTANATITNITDMKATRAKSIVNTTPETWGKRIAVIDMDLFAIDYSYQRVRTAHVNTIYDNWDNNECDPLIVSYRDGRFYIIDGQHRYYAALQKGIENLPCIVRTGLTKEDEARIFVKTNTSRKQLTPFDTFKANIANGNESIPEVKVDMTIKRICDKYNVTICRDNAKAAPRILRSISGARKYTKNTEHGEAFFDWVMKVITENSWRDCSDAYRDMFIASLHSYYADNLNNIEIATQKLVLMMDKYSPSDVMSYAKETYSDYGNFAGLSNTIRELA